MNIDTFSENDNTGQFDNTACLNTVGPEPVNFAFITKNGKATAPANPERPAALRAQPQARPADEPRRPHHGAPVRHGATACGS